MNFFEFMGDISYHDYSQFIQEVDIYRDNMLVSDKKLLIDRGAAVRAEDEFELTDGRMVIEYKKIKFDCFFYYKQSTKLYVFLNGALTQERPQFARWSYYKFSSGSVLNIADPMYEIYDELLLGWYYGNKDYNLRRYVAELVKIIAGKLGVCDHNIVFYGSSGGGAAVIECASHIEGAKAVSINPQIVLSEYFYADTFEKITGNILAEDHNWHRNNSIYYLRHNNRSKHLIMVNIRCEQDMRQISHICDAMGIRVKYGLNFFHDLVIWLYDCNCEPYVGPHNLQDNYCLFFAIEKLIENIDNEEFLEQYDSFYRYINEWWFAWWKQEQYWRSRQPNLHYLMECNKISKKIALFGTGDDAKKLCMELLDIDGENYYKIEAVLDNDENKAGKDFLGFKVMHSGDIGNWDDYFIIIATSKYAINIEKQLESYGLIYKKNFIRFTDLYK